MRRRFKRPTCLVISSLVVLSLMLVPCGLVASVNLSGKDVLVIAPPVGLLVSKSFSPPGIAGPLPNIIGSGACSGRSPNNIDISLAGTTVTIMECYR